MFPFRDNIPSSRFPVVTVCLIAINVLVFMFEFSLGRQNQAFIEEYALIPAHPTIPSLFTSMFLHGGWGHVIGNMWYLWIFGDNVEDRLGSARYLLFYLLCGLGADAAHILTGPDSTIPTIGASGAVAGVLGAYAVSYPNARIQTLMMLVFFIRIVELPAFVVLGFWFLMQLIPGFVSLGAISNTGGVAFWAHVGGFLVGIPLLFLMRQRERVIV